MEPKPIFVATHTRSCSTAFERIFMTCRDRLTCLHEPFGDAFFFGPERISPLLLSEPQKVQNSGRAHCTYDHVLQNILDVIQNSGKRVFVKDHSHHIIPPSHSPNATAPSLQHRFKSDDPPNPTLLPNPHLYAFQFIFLIRNPSASVPSLHRCFLPPLSEKTGEHTINPAELGYRETRMLFDHLYPLPSRSSQAGSNDKPFVIDAEDLLSHPEATLQAVCTYLNLPYSSSMLSWSAPEDKVQASSLFDKFAGYHEDALHSTGLQAKTTDREKWGKEAKTREEEDKEWIERYGKDAAKSIRDAVDSCRDDYDYLRAFKIKPTGN